MTRSKQTYDAYRGIRTLENCAHALIDALALVESTQAMTIHSADVCPRCTNDLKEIRLEPRFVRLIVFCPECHYFVLYDRLGRIKTFADHDPDGRPLLLTPKPSPDRPLERMIHKHLKSLRKDTRL